MLAAFSDDAIVREIVKRLGREEVLSALLQRLPHKLAAELAEGKAATRKLDYQGHQIELVLSSPAMVKRLRSVEKEPFTVEWIERVVKPGDVVYDVGANVGAYSLIAAKVSGNAARVYAFEPSPATFHALARNVLLNGCGESVVPVQLALWSRTGPVTIDLRSLAAGAARHRIDRKPAGGSSTLTVVGVQLDDLVEGLGLPVPTRMKLDVDGAELDVLRGAERTLARPEWQSLILELDPDETERNESIRALLAAAGFGAGTRHDRVASSRYPNPDERPDVYWSFERERRA